MIEHPTLEQCRQFWECLDHHVKDRQSAKCLIAAVQIAERLLLEKKQLEDSLKTPDSLQVLDCDGRKIGEPYKPNDAVKI